MSGASRETRIVLAACHPSSPTFQNLLTGDVRWDRLVERVRDLGLAPVMYRRVRDLNGDVRLPETAHMALAEAYYQRASVNAKLHSDLERALALLAQHDIAVVVLKGAALAEPFYGDIALRGMEDLDLLLLEDELAQANSVLQAEGYRPLEWYRPTAWYAKHSHHLAPLVSPDGAVVIELHRHIVPPKSQLRVAIEELWTRVRLHRIGSTQAFVLAPEDLLFHVCTHQVVARDFVGGVRTLCDIAVLLDRVGHEFDWNLFVSLCIAAGAASHVVHPILWARRLVGASVPDEVLQRLRSHIQPVPGHAMVDRLASSLLPRSPTASTVVPPWVTNALLGELLATPDRPVSAAWRVIKGVASQKRNGRRKTG